MLVSKPFSQLILLWLTLCLNVLMPSPSLAMDRGEAEALMFENLEEAGINNVFVLYASHTLIQDSVQEWSAGSAVTNVVNNYYFTSACSAANRQCYISINDNIIQGTLATWANDYDKEKWLILHETGHCILYFYMADHNISLPASMPADAQANFRERFADAWAYSHLVDGKNEWVDFRVRATWNNNDTMHDTASTLLSLSTEKTPLELFKLVSKEFPELP